VGDVWGKSISFSPEYIFNNASTDYGSVTVLSPTKLVIAYEDVGNSDYGTAIAGDTGIPVGIADAAASAGQSLPVIIHGISNHHSGLIPGKLYFAQPDGTLTANHTSTRIGLAVSETELLIDIER
jgi:hypothetical protein